MEQLSTDAKSREIWSFGKLQVVQYACMGHTRDSKQKPMGQNLIYGYLVWLNWVWYVIKHDFFNQDTTKEKSGFIASFEK